MRDELIRDWHPLDGRPAPEFIPSRWDGVHVGQRLIEALRVLARLPMNGYPQDFGSARPNYFNDFEDQVGWLQPDPRSGLIPERPPLQMLKLRPSSVEIERMEKAIIWPGCYVKDRRLLAAVQIVALGRSRDCDLEWVARKMGTGSAVVRKSSREH
jgi:hypothetical protein